MVMHGTAPRGGFSMEAFSVERGPKHVDAIRVYDITEDILSISKIAFQV
jgi:hypothetical protein